MANANTSSPKRNAPCPCGSGRKYKKCCEKTKPRETHVYAALPHPSELRLETDGKITFWRNSEEVTPINSFMDLVYKRPARDKDKIITRVPLTDGPKLQDPQETLCKYDTIYAIDTNTKTIGAQHYSVSAMSQWKPKRIKTKISVRCVRLYARIFTGECDKPERLAWKTAIEYINREIEDQPLHVALIVDSDLDSIGRINRKEEAVYDAFFLPERFLLIHATTDTSDTIQNKMIRLCDKDATRLLKAIEKDPKTFEQTRALALTPIRSRKKDPR